jgi:hypothetical protein
MHMHICHLQDIPSGDNEVPPTKESCCAWQHAAQQSTCSRLDAAGHMKDSHHITTQFHCQVQLRCYANSQKSVSTALYWCGSLHMHN